MRVFDGEDARLLSGHRNDHGGQLDRSRVVFGSGGQLFHVTIVLGAETMHLNRAHYRTNERFADFWKRRHKERTSLPPPAFALQDELDSACAQSSRSLARGSSV